MPPDPATRTALHHVRYELIAALQRLEDAAWSLDNGTPLAVSVAASGASDLIARATGRLAEIPSDRPCKICGKPLRLIERDTHHACDHARADVEGEREEPEPEYLEADGPMETGA